MLYALTTCVLSTRSTPARANHLALLDSVAPAVQHECIPQAIMGNDVLCQAKSGMGKTAVFVISILQQIKVQDDKPEVLAIVLCHTRELAYQVGVAGCADSACCCGMQPPRLGE